MVNNSYLTEKVDDLLKEFGATDEEKTAIYLLAMEFVARMLNEFVETNLTKEDAKYLDDVKDEDEARIYVERRIKEETGRNIAEVSDELLGMYLQEVQTAGYKEILKTARQGANG